MSGAPEPPRTDRDDGARPHPAGGASGLVRPEFQPTLPGLLRGRGRLPWAVAIAAIVGLLAGIAAARATGPQDAPALLVHRQPDFSMLIRTAELRRVAPRGDEYVRLEGRGGQVSVRVSVAPLPRTPAGGQPALAELPISTDRVIDSLRRREDGFVVLDEGRARLNDALGYQVRHRSGPAGAPRFGHEVLLVPEPPATGPGLLVSMAQRNEAPALGPRDRGLVFEAKRAFRSVRFGIERP